MTGVSSSKISDSESKERKAWIHKDWGSIIKNFARGIFSHFAGCILFSSEPTGAGLPVIYASGDGRWLSLPFHTVTEHQASLLLLLLLFCINCKLVWRLTPCECSRGPTLLHCSTEGFHVLN